jgi:hypothetical protein
VRRDPPPVRVVERSKRSEDTRALERPPFGTRGEGERAAPPPVPRYEEKRAREADTRERPQDLPGEPANRVWRQREARPRQRGGPTPAAQDEVVQTGDPGSGRGHDNGRR